MEDNLNIKQMEDNLNILANERRLQYFCKWTTTSFFLENGKQHKSFWQMEDELKFFFLSLWLSKHCNSIKFLNLKFLKISSCKSMPDLNVVEQV